MQSSAWPAASQKVRQPESFLHAQQRNSCTGTLPQQVLCAPQHRVMARGTAAPSSAPQTQAAQRVPALPDLPSEAPLSSVWLLHR